MAKPNGQTKRAPPRVPLSCLRPRGVGVNCLVAQEREAWRRKLAHWNWGKLLGEPFGCKCAECLPLFDSLKVNHTMSVSHNLHRGKMDTMPVFLYTQMESRRADVGVGIYIMMIECYCCTILWSIAMTIVLHLQSHTRAWGLHDELNCQHASWTLACSIVILG